MPLQKSITSFFSPKAGLTSPKPSAMITPQKRKATTDADDTIEDNLSLSPAQRQRMGDNEAKAKVLLATKRFPGALHSSIGGTWYNLLSDEFDKQYFSDLNSFLEQERKSAPNGIFPPAADVWSWTHHFDVADTKVVILGQDPYHGPGQAHGLCFSVKKGVAAPPSLVNIFKELERDTEGFLNPGHGDLTGWARQGVLLLNACLTVRKANANSHANKGWENITDAVIKGISAKCNGVVFLLWGAYAQKKAAAVDTKRHHLLKSVHPSPLSAHRGFIGCGHFSKCNDLLRKAGKKPIDWANL